MAIQVKTKKWGNSIGIIIPSKTIEEFGIKPEENLTIEINKKENVLRELFGSGKIKGKTAKKIVAEARKELESKWI